MNKLVARCIAIIGTGGLVVAVIGALAGLSVVMWVGIGLFSIVVVLAIISLITGKRLLPTDDEIFLGGKE